MHSLDVGEWVVIGVIILAVSWIVGFRLVYALRYMQQERGRRDALSLLAQAAEEMAMHPARREAEEIAYLLEALAGHVDRETYCQVLEAVQGDVAARLRLARAY
jgi:Tfp pilus assembly protein PilV